MLFPFKRKSILSDPLFFNPLTDQSRLISYSADSEADQAIEKYVNIQRIKKHGQEEVEYQEKITKAELQMLGISTEDLEINK